MGQHFGNRSFGQRDTFSKPQVPTMASPDKPSTEGFQSIMGRPCPKLVQFHCAVLFAHEVAKGQWAEKARVHQVQVDLKTDTSMRQYEAEHALENVDPIKLEEHIARLSESRQYTMIHEQNRSWACQDLQEFRIVLQFEHLAGAAWDEQVFQQLAALTKLQLIDICRPVHPSTIAIPERKIISLIIMPSGRLRLDTCSLWQLQCHNSGKLVLSSCDSEDDTDRESANVLVMLNPRLVKLNIMDLSPAPRQKCWTRVVGAVPSLQGLDGGYPLDSRSVAESGMISSNCH
ncbi:hypothetical protein BGZ83_005649 [Gryganskiella cystojenkinii]|nr:hypothetical protein BGZ83_005649 [Gryganskiella cystojenkinii]